MQLGRIWRLNPVTQWRPRKCVGQTEHSFRASQKKNNVFASSLSTMAIKSNVPECAVDTANAPQWFRNARDVCAGWELTTWTRRTNKRRMKKKRAGDYRIVSYRWGCEQTHSTGQTGGVMSTHDDNDNDKDNDGFKVRRSMHSELGWMIATRFDLLPKLNPHPHRISEVMWFSWKLPRK